MRGLHGLRAQGCVRCSAARALRPQSSQVLLRNQHSSLEGMSRCRPVPKRRHISPSPASRVPVAAGGRRGFVPRVGAQVALSVVCFLLGRAGPRIRVTPGASRGINPLNIRTENHNTFRLSLQQSNPYQTLSIQGRGHSSPRHRAQGAVIVPEAGFAALLRPPYSLRFPLGVITWIKARLRRSTPCR